MYVNPERLFDEYAKRCTVESKMGKLLSFIFNNFIIIVFASSLFVSSKWLSLFLRQLLLK